MGIREGITVRTAEQSSGLQSAGSPNDVRPHAVARASAADSSSPGNRARRACWPSTSEEPIMLTKPGWIAYSYGDCLSMCQPGGPRRALDVTWRPDSKRSRHIGHLAWHIGQIALTGREMRPSRPQPLPDAPHVPASLSDGVAFPTYSRGSAQMEARDHSLHPPVSGRYRRRMFTVLSTPSPRPIRSWYLPALRISF